MSPGKASRPGDGAATEKADRTRAWSQVVIHDRHVATRFRKMLRDAGRGVGRDVAETRRVVVLGHRHDAVFQRTLVPQVVHGLRHGGSALANGAIDTVHIFSALVRDSVYRKGGLACLPVAQKQLALAAPDGNQRINDLHAGLERHGDGCAAHNGRRGAFDGRALAGGAPARCHRGVDRAGR